MGTDRAGSLRAPTEKLLLRVRALSKRHLAITVILCMVGIQFVAPLAAYAVEPLKNFLILLKKDKGLTETEKENWQKLME